MSGRPDRPSLKLGRLGRGITEFLVLPLTVTLLLCTAAVLLAILDRQEAVSSWRRAAGAIIPSTGAGSFVGTVAGSLMTVTSITFSVLLIAVQQTSSSLGAVVFDQYLRRRSNQVYVGYFVGATAFAFIVYACASPHSPPVLGALAALLLTVGSLVVLPLLIYSTVDQMRPECVVESIHRQALKAHEHELLLLAGTRRRRRTAPTMEGRDIRSMSAGYVVRIDARRLAAIARSAGTDAEVFLPCQLGTYCQPGQIITTIVGVGASDDQFDAEALSAFRLDQTRRVEVDAGYSIDQLENIGWMSATSAQSPYTATAAIHQLQDLVSRWAVDEARFSDTSPTEYEPLPVVYTDGAIERVITTFGNLLTASSQSGQSDTAALLITAFARALPRLESGHHQDGLIRSLHAALPSVAQQANCIALSHALTELVANLDRAGRDTRSVRQVQTVLREAMNHLTA